MFILHNAIYRPVALSPADKQKKRDMQLEQKFQEVMEDEGWATEWTREELIENVLDFERDTQDSGYKGGIVDPQDPGEAITEKVNDLMSSHFNKVYPEERIKEVVTDYVDTGLDDRFTRANEVYEKAVKEHGANSDIVKTLEVRLDEIEEEYNGTIEPHEGDAWYEAVESLEQEHWEQYYEEIIEANFTTESKVVDFLTKRHHELETLANGGDIWRGVVIEAKKDPTTNRGLGEYWTDREDLARPFLKEMNRMEGWHDPVVVRYHARVDDLKYVNLKDSMLANAWAFIHEGYPTDMNEVQFFKYAPIYVYEVEVLDTDPYSPEYGASVLETYPIEAVRRA